MRFIPSIRLKAALNRYKFFKTQIASLHSQRWSYAFCIAKPIERNLLLRQVGGAIEPKARIEFKQLNGGCKRVAYANAVGIYDLKGISPGEYLATMSVKGKPSMTANVVIITGESVVGNFGMIL